MLSIFVDLKTTWQICHVVFKSTIRENVTNFSRCLYWSNLRKRDRLVMFSLFVDLYTTWQICHVVSFGRFKDNPKIFQALFISRFEDNVTSNHVISIHLFEEYLTNVSHCFFWSIWWNVTKFSRGLYLSIKRQREKFVK